MSEGQVLNKYQLKWIQIASKTKEGGGERKQKQCDDSEKGWEAAFAQMVRKVFFFFLKITIILQ